MGLPNHLCTIYSSLPTKFEFIPVHHGGQVFAKNIQDDEKVLLEREK